MWPLVKMSLTPLPISLYLFFRSLFSAFHCPSLRDFFQILGHGLIGNHALSQGCQTHFRRGPHRLAAAFKGQNVISTPYQLRSSYIYTVLKIFQPFEGNCKADVAPSENEFDTPALSCIARVLPRPLPRPYPLSLSVIYVLWFPSAAGGSFMSHLFSLHSFPSFLV